MDQTVYSPRTRTKTATIFQFFPQGALIGYSLDLFWRRSFMSTDTFEADAEREIEGIRPLRKKTLGGTPYARDAAITAKLQEVLALPRSEIVERCALQERKDPAYIPSECLLYVVRNWEPDDDKGHFERIYKALIERVLRKLPAGESADGKGVSLLKSRKREALFDRFVDLLAKDRTTCALELDYFEVRFDGALASMRYDILRKTGREPYQVPIEIDPESGDLAPEVERAMESFDPFDPVEMEREDYRSRLDQAIETLPVEQKQIIEMMRKDIPIDSINPAVVTIAKTLGKSERTIRAHRDQAIFALRAILKKGELR